MPNTSIQRTRSRAPRGPVLRASLGEVLRDLPFLVCLLGTASLSSSTPEGLQSLSLVCPEDGPRPKRDRERVKESETK